MASRTVSNSSKCTGRHSLCRFARWFHQSRVTRLAAFFRCRLSLSWGCPSFFWRFAQAIGVRSCHPAVLGGRVRLLAFGNTPERLGTHRLWVATLHPSRVLLVPAPARQGGELCTATGRHLRGRSGHAESAGGAGREP